MLFTIGLDLDLAEKKMIKAYLIASTLLTGGQLWFAVSISDFISRQELVEAHAVVLLVTLLHEVFRGQLQELVGRHRKVLLNVIHD